MNHTDRNSMGHMRSYGSNLLPRFHALSVLHPLGSDSTLLRANKKDRDIVMVRRGVTRELGM